MDDYLFFGIGRNRNWTTIHGSRRCGSRISKELSKKDSAVAAEADISPKTFSHYDDIAWVRRSPGTAHCIRRSLKMTPWIFDITCNCRFVVSRQAEKKDPSGIHGKCLRCERLRSKITDTHFDRQRHPGLWIA